MPEHPWHKIQKIRREMHDSGVLLPMLQFKVSARQKGPRTKLEEAADRERVRNLRGAVGPDFVAQCEKEMQRAASSTAGGTDTSCYCETSATRKLSQKLGNSETGKLWNWETLKVRNSGTGKLGN